MCRIFVQMCCLSDCYMEFCLLVLWYARALDTRISGIVLAVVSVRLTQHGTDIINLVRGSCASVRQNAVIDRQIAVIDRPSVFASLVPPASRHRMLPRSESSCVIASRCPPIFLMIHIRTHLRCSRTCMESISCGQ